MTGLTEASRRLLDRSQAFRDALDPVIVEDLETRIIDLDDAAVRFYGWSRYELIGQRIHRIIAPEWHGWLMGLRRRCRAGENLRGIENVRVTRSGGRIPVLLTMILLRDEAGAPVGFATIAKDVTDLRRAQRAAEDVERRERRTLAADLHDSVGQLVPLARMKLAALREERAASPLAGKLAELDGMLDRVEREIRTLTFQLSPATLKDLGLVDAAEELAESLRSSIGLDVTVEDDGLPKPLIDAHAETVVRGLRELLMNVARHARTDEARVFLHREDGEVTVTVEDAGVGFDPAQWSEGFGLRTYRARLESLGGCLQIDSSPGAGTRARLHVPLEEPAPS